MIRCPKCRKTRISIDEEWSCTLTFQQDGDVITRVYEGAPDLDITGIVFAKCCSCGYSWKLRKAWSPPDDVQLPDIPRLPPL